ncbi:MAG: hypothetical protein JWN70_525 [Planctomycetaceae bacterium]|nr:hypothetical protein [Planctomycetaceae bacterium]
MADAASVGSQWAASVTTGRYYLNLSPTRLRESGYNSFMEKDSRVPSRILPATQYAQHRDWSVTQFPLAQFLALQAAWDFSQSLLREISSALAAADLSPEIVTVGIAGSLARMEATAESDCDLVVVLRGEVSPESEVGARAFAGVWKALALLQLEAPEKAGIYAAPVSISQLLDSQTLGKVSEEQRVFGSRILFLQELQPVWGDEAFRELTRGIVERYASQYVAVDQSKQWSYLLNDLVRYFKSLCQTYMFGELANDTRWRLRNLKARHSRLLIYVGLLFLLGESSRTTERKQDWLAERLTWTPAERLAALYAEYGDDQFGTLAECLNRFVAAMSTPGFRESLSETLDPDSPLARESNPAFAKMKENADEFLSELLRFALARRDDWAERFFEYWLF